MPWLDVPFKEIEVKDVYSKDENLKKAEVLALMKWVENQPHLPSVTELQIILFLHSVFYHTEIAKIAIDNYFTAKTNHADIFGSRTLKDPLFKTATNCILMAPLLTLTSSGDLVMIGRLMDYNSSNYSAAGHIRLFDVITLLYLHQNGPVNGMQVVADLNHSGFGHFMKYGPTIVKIFLHYLQEAMPIRLKYVHVINVSYFVDKMLALIRPFLKKELYESIKIHTEIETLYEYVPKNLLPKDYGGQSDSSEILQAKIINLIESSEEFLAFQDNQVVDEAKRLKSV